MYRPFCSLPHTSLMDCKEHAAQLFHSTARYSHGIGQAPHKKPGAGCQPCCSYKFPLCNQTLYVQRVCVCWGEEGEVALFVKSVPKQRENQMLRGVSKQSEMIFQSQRIQCQMTGLYSQTFCFSVHTSKGSVFLSDTFASIGAVWRLGRENKMLYLQNLCKALQASLPQTVLIALQATLCGNNYT